MVFRDMSTALDSLIRRVTSLERRLVKVKNPPPPPPNPNLPFAMAAGIVNATHAANTAAYAGVVVTLPTGRFTVPPVPAANLFTGTGGAQKDVVRAYQSTVSTITLGVWVGDGSAGNIAHTDMISWIAVQMTEGSAAG